MPKSKGTRTSSMDTDSQAGDGASAETSARSRPQRSRQPPKRYQHSPEPEIIDVVGEVSQPLGEAGDAPQPAPARPKKGKASTSTTKRSRKKAVVDSDDEATASPKVSSPPPECCSRTAESDPAEDDLSVGHPSPLHSPAAGPSKRRLTSGRKRKASESEGEGEEYSAHAGRARTESDVEDEFLADSPPPPKRKRSLPPGKLRGGKGKDKDIVIGKDERAARPPPRDDGTPMDIESTPSASPAPTATGPAPSLPNFKKKLPSMRKTGSVGGSSAGSGTPARSRPKPADSPTVDEPDHSLDFKKPKKVAAKQELNLMDKGIYASLFKSGSAPRGGVDVKSKEEKRAAMNKLRDEDCARREAQWSNTFDLRAQHEKVTSFAKRMEARNGPSIYPNILASSLRMELHQRRKQGQSQP